jgi:hypothetical protein
MPPSRNHGQIGTAKDTPNNLFMGFSSSLVWSGAEAEAGLDMLKQEGKRNECY